MATKRFKELKSLSKDELATKLRELEQQFFESKMKHVTGQLENTASLWKTRKDIARMKMLTALQGAPSTQKSAKKTAKAGKAAGGTKQ